MASAICPSLIEGSKLAREYGLAIALAHLIVRVASPQQEPLPARHATTIAQDTLPTHTRHVSTIAPY
jgi:hypothetical protein